MRWAGHVARRQLVRPFKERDHLKERGVDGRIYEVWGGGVDCFHVTSDTGSHILVVMEVKSVALLADCAAPSSFPWW
jgi:hypothetical protein